MLSVHDYQRSKYKYGTTEDVQRDLERFRVQCHIEEVPDPDHSYRSLIQGENREHQAVQALLRQY